jgi:hypothetical protein
VHSRSPHCSPRKGWVGPRGEEWDPTRMHGRWGTSPGMNSIVARLKFDDGSETAEVTIRSLTRWLAYDGAGPHSSAVSLATKHVIAIGCKLAPARSLIAPRAIENGDGG